MSVPGIGMVQDLKRWLRRKGYGVHSPFVYNLIREVYNRQSGKKGLLYQSLVERGFDPEIAGEFDRLASYYPTAETKLYTKKGVAKLGITNGTGKGSFIILEDPALVDERLIRNLEASVERKVLAILKDKSKQQLLGNIITETNCLAVETKDYILLFFDYKLSPQWFKI